jgi:hypothetical protein
MNENAKTLTFLAVAAAAAVAAIVVSRPAASTSGTENLRGQLLYPTLNDPLAVTSMEIVEFDEETGTSMEIVEFDEDTGTVHPFRVAQVDVKGKARWAIPSHDNYPADAKDQVASAAASLMGLRIVDSVSDAQGDQREYGVVKPDMKTLKLGDTGVGEEVVMKNKKDKVLLDLVIGKEVPDRPGLRYVRKADEDGIYVVDVKTDKLSTKFEDWIERNLLQISSFDISRLWIRDYAIKAMREGLAIVQRGEMELEHNDAGEPKWKMAEDRKFVPDDKGPKGGHWTAVKMAAGEELDTAKLDEMMGKLDELKIVDVSRKPKGVSAELKASADFGTKSEAALESLADKGFYIAQLDKQVELFSNEGEIRVGGKDGVQYVLRFGDIAGAGRAKKDDKKKEKGKAEKEKKKDAAGPGLNRYLFIMAELNPNLIAKPQLESIPQPKKEAEKKPAEAKKTEPAKKEVEKKPPEKKPEAKKAEPKAGEKKAAEKKAEAEAAKKQEAEKKAADEERARVEKENKRRQEEYQQKIADGKKRVEELNARFADWYYIISDDVYRKIHLNRDEIVKKKEPPKKDKAGKERQPLPKSPFPPGEG